MRRRALVRVRRKLTMVLEWSSHPFIREHEGTYLLFVFTATFLYSCAIVGLNNEFLYEVKLKTSQNS
jgi:hypothetical protein